MVTGIRRWSGKNRAADGMAISSVSGPGSTARPCPSDPRRIPYLLVWKSERDGEIKEAVRPDLDCAKEPQRLAHYFDPHDPHSTNNHVELKRTDGSVTVLRFVWRALPRNGGRALLLVCSYCNTPRRRVYGWDGTVLRDGQT